MIASFFNWLAVCCLQHNAWKIFLPYLTGWFLLWQLVLEADGYQPYLLSPEKGLRALIKKALELAKDPAKSCVDEVCLVTRSSPNYIPDTMIDKMGFSFRHVIGGKTVDQKQLLDNRSCLLCCDVSVIFFKLANLNMDLRFCLSLMLSLFTYPEEACNQVHRILVDIVSAAASGTPGLGRYPPLKREVCMTSVVMSSFFMKQENLAFLRLCIHSILFLRDNVPCIWCTLST